MRTAGYAFLFALLELFCREFPYGLQHREPRFHHGSVGSLNEVFIDQR